MQQQTLTNLTIEYFFQKFKEKMDLLLDDNIFIGLYDKDELEDSTWTMLFDTAIFLAVKELNDKHGLNLSIAPEEATGRGGYTDISIFSSDGKIKYFQIEHENRPKSRIKNTRRLIKTSLEKTVYNLSKSDANSKIIITYYFDDYKREELNKDIEQYKNKWVKSNNNANLFLFLASSDKASEFDLIKI